MIHHGDCLEVMRGMEDNSVGLIATDPPYFKVKGESWDRQWDKPDKFLAWLRDALEQFHRILQPNGSLYVFASPRMAARVEVTAGERFDVLNRIRWVKSQGWHRKAKKEELRSYLSPWEEIIFAQHYGSDGVAKGESGWGAKCDELRGFVFEPLRKYLSDEWKRAGLKGEDANKACGTVSMAARHYFARSQWCLPTEEHYESLRRYANQHDGDEFLRRDYEDLRRDYEFLRRDYEDLRRDYEDLRRPFNVSPDVPFTDVWDFPTVSPYKGKHPCEKPVELMRHIVRVSTKSGMVVFDPFMGSGTTGVACALEGVDFIGIEREAEYHETAKRRIDGTRTGTEDA